uniref:Uncharacterized protein n=1 Tax=Magnetococcus massalia (strain MO-1) TaxID=451514 RepID=A0A1S7LHQ6_MAGMO|nr:protein of unknown function [Candidatus Magnetococcus massalia]
MEPHCELSSLKLVIKPLADAAVFLHKDGFNPLNIEIFEKVVCLVLLFGSRLFHQPHQAPLASGQAALLMHERFEKRRKRAFSKRSPQHTL